MSLKKGIGKEMIIGGKKYLVVGLRKNKRIMIDLKQSA